jgi:hypothetical protein
MGPTDGVFSAEREMEALVRAHPTLTYIPRGTHVATWMEDDGPHVEERATLRDLVLYLRARFGAR